MSCDMCHVSCHVMSCHVMLCYVLLDLSDVAVGVLLVGAAVLQRGGAATLGLVTVDTWGALPSFNLFVCYIDTLIFLFRSIRISQIFIMGVSGYF